MGRCRPARDDRGGEGDVRQAGEGRDAFVVQGLGEVDAEVTCGSLNFLGFGV